MPVWTINCNSIFTEIVKKIEDKIENNLWVGHLWALVIAISEKTTLGYVILSQPPTHQIVLDKAVKNGNL